MNALKAVFVAFLTLSFNALALDKALQAQIQVVKNAFQQNDVEAISKLVAYPLNREHPIPAIKNEAEFINRYKDVFDDALINLIINSDTEKDWSQMGWRGVMLSHGVVWIDAAGFISAINHQSATEVAMKKELINRSKQKVHASLQNYKKSILAGKTKNRILRIDELDGGSYRLALWALDKTQKDAPSLVLGAGEMNMEGSGGGYSFKFEKDKQLYLCYVFMGHTPDSPSIAFEIHEGYDIKVIEGVKEMIKAN
ncbi:hypothetical protein [Pseudoalteromonas sp. MTN2-4]|uniref:hypothetical protein n=1 Tax=Pseudoalteromonas sp. MTN2-4 TaxID=3056555 RepID=UPI0036F40B30